MDIQKNTLMPTQLVQSSRILYTPSFFARSSLLHLQEVGSLQALHPHTSMRSNLASYLVFFLMDGNGELKYEGITYQLTKGDCVFIDCRKSYSHTTPMGLKDNDIENFCSDSLWTLQWAHFYGATLNSIYDKYRERGGQPVFHPSDSSQIPKILTLLYEIAGSEDYIRDMRINQVLNELLTLLMEQSWNPEMSTPTKKQLELSSIKNYLDEHFTEKIELKDLEKRFFISRYYLSKIFKETYGSTIINYLILKRITKAKKLLRFTEMTMDEISIVVGFSDANYFSRTFKKIEGTSPSQYRRNWQNFT